MDKIIEERVQKIRDKISGLEERNKTVNPNGFDYKFTSLHIYGLNEALSIIEGSEKLVCDCPDEKDVIDNCKIRCDRHQP